MKHYFLNPPELDCRQCRAAGLDVGFISEPNYCEYDPPTDSLDEANETWGPRIFPRDRSPVAAVLLLVGAVAFVVGCFVFGVAR